MHSDNSIHIVTAAKRRHAYTRAKAIAAIGELDRAGNPITFQAVAAAAEVSRSWLYTQADIKDEICRLRAQRRPKTRTTAPDQQRADEASLRHRLDLATQRNRELAAENQRLRRQLARALGLLRDDARLPATSRRNPITIDDS
jgi:hypothetical protein